MKKSFFKKVLTSTAAIFTIAALTAFGTSVYAVESPTLGTDPAYATLSVMTEDYFRDHEDLDLIAFCNWLRENLSSWKRKDFNDFKYLSVSLTPTQNYVLFALVVAINIGLAYLILQMTQPSVPV